MDHYQYDIPKCDSAEDGPEHIILSLVRDGAITRTTAIEILEAINKHRMG